MLRVSSVLNKDVKQFGKQHLIDGSEETCWNSDSVCADSVVSSEHEVRVCLSAFNQGVPQFIVAEFDEDVRPRQLTLMFQGVSLFRRYE